MSQPLANLLPSAVVETVLTHLAALFLTGAAGDIIAAARPPPRCWPPTTPKPRTNSVSPPNIVGFSFQALEALGQAATRTCR